MTLGAIVVEAEGGFSPKKLPRHEDAPIVLHGGGKISALGGGLPPILKELTLLFDQPRLGRDDRPACLPAGVAAGDDQCAGAEGLRGLDRR